MQKLLSGTIALWGTIALCLSATALPAAAQHIYDGPRSCLVRGLDPNGDGFLSIRTGPSTRHREIGRLYNGDFVHFDVECGHRTWCHSDNFNRRGGRPLNLAGWISNRWCEFYP